MAKLIRAKITVLPTDSKNDNFVLALIDYFNEEFKRNKLKTTKSNGYVKVALDGVYDDKYDCVIVDCCNGKLYLRGGSVKDKYFGRLSKFVSNRKSDAYHCVNYNATRIINRIKKLNESFQQNQQVPLKRLIAQSKNIKEEYLTNSSLEKKLNDVFFDFFKKQISSEKGQEFFAKNSTSVVLKDTNVDVINVITNFKYRQQLIDFVNQQHIDLPKYDDDEIVSLFDGYVNIYGEEECNALIKQELQAKYDDLAKELKELNDEIGDEFETGKLNIIDYFTREYPFIYYKGEVYVGQKGETHNQIMKRMFGDIGEEDNDFFRPKLNNIENYNKEDAIAFGHVINGIGFVEFNEVHNCTLDEVAEAVKANTDVIKVYTTDTGRTSTLKRVADLRPKRILDLRNPIKVADLRECKTIKIADLRITSENKKNFYQEYATDKDLHSLVDQRVFEFRRL